MIKGKRKGKLSREENSDDRKNQMIVKILTTLPVSPQNDARSLGIIAGNNKTIEG
jgi:hypothetical protein